ncbi:unnamed protein product [Cylindrotheca closterium]|uniref:Uncharacterized protein n=1 Tax=Cylindrotheca closterium TaxID=2856 RepID=A0AAD2PUA1_9STRA|nr:unnamed protein product [Cylindrotheca closterium]
MKKSISRTSSNVSAYMLKFYIVVGTAILLTLAAVLNHTRPKFLFGKPRPKVRPFRLTSIYPPGIKIESDLPRFFRTYSIATPHNENARKAVIKMVNSRRVLRQRSGSYKTYLKTWDESSASMLIERQICGHDFESVYKSSSAERKNDLIMWCMMSVTKTEGFFLNSVELLESPLLLTKGKGIVVRSAASPSSLSIDMYLHPRNMTHEDDMAIVPAQLLARMIETPESGSYSAYREEMEQRFHDIVFSDSNKEKYMILTEICQKDRPLFAISKKCESSSCCYIVVPEEYGSFIFESSSEN